MAHPANTAARAGPKPARGLAVALVGAALLVAAVQVVSPAAYVDHASRAIARGWFHDDARQYIWPLLRYRDPQLFAGDIIADYYLSFPPFGWRTFYRAAAVLVDPRALSAVLPYLQFAAFLGLVGAAAARLGGRAAMLGALVICLAADLYLAQMTGAVARSFGYPLIALLLLGLVLGRPGWVVAATLLGAAFYYVVAPIGGLALASYLLLLPARWRGGARDWSLRRRAAVVGATGALCALLVLPSAWATAQFGARLRPEQVDAFPEAGPRGRYDWYDRFQSERLLPTAFEIASRTFALFPRADWKRAPVEKLYPALAVLAAVIGAALQRRRPEALRALLLPLSALACFELAAWLSPHLWLPRRYLTYGLPVALAVLFPVGLAAIAARLPAARAQPALRLLLVVGPALLVAGATRSPERFVYCLIHIPEQEAPLHAFLGRLPRDALIAGWPTGAVQNVPLLSERSVLVSHETHQALHVDYTLEMRRRTLALIDAIYAARDAPLARLRDAFGVTHLVVRPELYGPAPPPYFAPFDEPIAHAHAALGGRRPAALAQPAAEVYRDAHFLVLDLAEVGAR